jgi:TonB family protein
MRTRLFIAFFSIATLVITGQLEVAAAARSEQPDAIRVVWNDGHRSEVSEKELKQHAVYSEHPEYPISARRAKITGVGVYILHVDKKTGAVAQVDVELSTGSKVLDLYATNAFKKWRFVAGVFLQVRMPCAFNSARPENPWVY